ncbi:MAG: glycosyltransferase family 39 protein [Chloroflexota bacterium]|nr:MAG: glycosyltransferase family 39 protein [Chloroflexota bacterium]
MRGLLTLPGRSSSWRISTRAEVAALGFIIVLGALLRLLWLDTIPAGWHHDEALMGIMASEVFRGDQRPIFFPAYLGQEPLYIYLSAAMMWLLGGNQDVLPLRLTSALIGTGTIGVAYLLGREMFGRRMGLITAALQALSFWQILMSRDGYRSITQPPLEGLTMFLLWRASRRNSVWYYVAAGVALGGCIYTYLGARLFPGTLVVFAFWCILARRWPSVRMRIGLTAFLVVAGLVSAPLLIYFATHPGTFSARIDQVMVLQPGNSGSEPLQAMGQNFLRLLGKFTVQGDTLWRFNLAGRPFFVGAAGVLFYLGLLAAAVGAVRRKPAPAMVLAWFVAMLFPSFLSVGTEAYGLRSMGLAPGVFLLPALGFVAVWDLIAARAPRAWQPGTHLAMGAVLIVILSIEGGTTYRDYFTDWAHTFGNAYESMEDMVDAARFIAREARPEDQIFVSSDYYPHPIVTQLAPQIYPRVRWFDGNSALVLTPQRTQDSLYAFPYSANAARLESYLPTEGLKERSTFPNGVQKLAAYRLTPQQVETAINNVLNDPAITRANRNLGDQIEMLGYRLDPRVEQGGKLEATAVWRVLKDPTIAEYVMFAHLLDSQWNMVAQHDTSMSFPTREWRAGDVFLARYPLQVSDRVAPGKYFVAVGIYDRGTMKRLSTVGEFTAENILRLDFVEIEP